jgi:hypothetical protein
MILKKNRSNVYTKGITINANDNDNRYVFFELDLDHKRFFSDVIHAYRDYGFDYLCHRTGNGYHFISPCVVTKEEWKQFHSELKHINKKCPMTTLRWIPNKYPNESEIWFLSEYWKDECPIHAISIEMADLLNHTFGSEFVGDMHTKIEFVTYPLPFPLRVDPPLSRYSDNSNVWI